MAQGCYNHEIVAVCMARFRAVLKHGGGILGPSWGHLGASLGPSWSHLGAILGPSCFCLCLFTPLYDLTTYISIYTARNWRGTIFCPQDFGAGIARATPHLSDQVCKAGATLARSRRTGIALCSVAPSVPVSIVLCSTKCSCGLISVTADGKSSQNRCTLAGS